MEQELVMVTSSTIAEFTSSLSVSISPSLSSSTLPSRLGHAPHVFQSFFVPFPC